MNVLITTIATAVATTIATLLQTYITKHVGNNKAMVILLRQHLRCLYKDYCDRDTLSYDEYEEFLEAYQTYHDLGGNGTGTKMMKDIETKKIKESE